MAKTQGFPSRDIPQDMGQSDSICTLLFKQIDKPSNYKMCKAINVYDNKYRINIYTHEVINDIESQRISQSYFAKLAGDGASLEILMKPAPVDSKKKK
jgi:hypothetical protein